MSNRSEILEMIEKIQNGLALYHGYEIGKMPNEYLTGQKNSPLATFTYDDIKVSLFVDALASVEIPGEKTIFLEKDLDELNRKLIREGLIAFKFDNYFYFNSEDYIDRIYQNDIEELPTRIDLKMKFIHDIIDTMIVKGWDEDVEKLSKVKMVQKVIPEKSKKPFGIKAFRDSVQSLLEKDDLIDHLEIIQVDCSFSLYDGSIHYELLYYTENIEVENYIRSAFDGLFV